MGIFDKRIAIKPFEYPEVIKYMDSINHSYWLVSEYNFISDVNDFKVNLNDRERNAVKNAMLAISQIEVSVKKFWGNLENKIPKTEFGLVGISFAESENRHLMAYSNLLDILDLNNEFDNILQNPVIAGRVDYLTKYLKGASDNSNENFALSLALFSIFIENISLFSQFLIMKSFNKYKNMLKDIDNVVQSTLKEEVIHALFGVELLNIIKKEYPEWFDENFYSKLYRAAKKAYDAEEKIIEWMFEMGDLDFLTTDQVKEFTKKRFNESLGMMGGEPLFDINNELIKDLSWFDDEILAEVNTDFFYKKPTTYSKFNKSIKSEDLF